MKILTYYWALERNTFKNIPYEHNEYTEDTLEKVISTARKEYPNIYIMIHKNTVFFDSNKFRQR